ncbi:hypothetical protein E2562_029880 [Oryza meyeriana var. granulata]|uniref:Uncharacterized protein n=1 Tax=Oryza meyeriana var. granulata TaxID=110450 RepID=A0A6G1CUL8_9ORYZ|nr:hypothetical protein E2562_029880 [Oryza meyeriana var. granulata]
MASVPSVTVFFGLLVSMYATGFFSHLDVQSGAKNFVQAPPLDAAVQTVLLVAAAMVALNTAVALIYACLYNAAAGGGGAADRRIPQVVYFIMFASFGVLHVFLVPQPGAIDGGQDLLPLAIAVVRVLRPAAAAATFFLSVTLIYAHVRAGGAGGAGGAAGNVPIPTTVKLLTKLVLAAALVTVVLTLTATILASYD